MSKQDGVIFNIIGRDIGDLAARVQILEARMDVLERARTGADVAAEKLSKDEGMYESD